MMEDRFWSKVNKADGCWMWTGSTSSGYPHFRFDGRTLYAHRVAYELAIGEIPSGLQLDHTCHSDDPTCEGGDACLHRRCVNPAHLEPVTPAVNASRTVQSRRTHCPQGHPYDEANTYSRLGGGRACRTCQREATRRWRKARQ